MSSWLQQYLHVAPLESAPASPPESWLAKYGVPDVRPDATAATPQLRASARPRSVGPALPGNIPLPRGRYTGDAARIGDPNHSILDLARTGGAALNPIAAGEDALTSSFNAGRRASAAISGGKYGSALGEAAGTALTAGTLALPEGAVGRVFGRLLGKSAAPFERFAVMTAENPGGRAASAAVNEAGNAKLEAMLRKRGYNPVPTVGRYPDEKTGELLTERGFMVPNMPHAEAEALGRQFKQNSVLTDRGLHDLVDNKVYPATDLHATGAGDVAHTELPNGKKFSMDLNFKDPVRYFDHYSPQPNLNELDPAYMGTGLAGAEKARSGRTAASHVYAAGTKPEPQFAKLNKYSVGVRGNIYDIAADPDGIVAKVRQNGGGADAMERAVQKAGYVGYNNGDYYPDTYKLFGKHPVERADVGRAATDSVLSRVVQPTAAQLASVGVRPPGFGPAYPNSPSGANDQLLNSLLSEAATGPHPTSDAARASARALPTDMEIPAGLKKPALDSLTTRGASMIVRPKALTGPITDPNADAALLKHIDKAFKKTGESLVDMIERSSVANAVSDKSASLLKYNPRTQELSVHEWPTPTGGPYWIHRIGGGTYTPQQLQEVLGAETADKLLATQPVTEKIGTRGGETLYEKDPVHVLEDGNTHPNRGSFRFSPSKVNQGRQENTLQRLGADRVNEILGIPATPGSRVGAKAPAVITAPNSGDVFDVSKLGLNVPAGVSTDRPPLKRPGARANLSVLEPVKRKMRDVYTPNVLKALKENPEAAGWYDTTQPRDAFADQSPTGADDFRQFALFHGPTSIGTKVPDNMRQASYMYYLWKNAQNDPAKLDALLTSLKEGTLELPKGYANRRQKSVNAGIARILETGNLDPFETPKTFRYSNQLAGDMWGGIAADMHVGRQTGRRGLMPNAKGELVPDIGFPTPGYTAENPIISSSPANNQYPTVEDAAIRQASNLGLAPTQYQSLGWVGGADQTGVADSRPWLSIFNQKLRDTQKKYGFNSPMDAFTAFAQGKTPLWAMLPAAAMGGGLLYGNDQQR